MSAAGSDPSVARRAQLLADRASEVLDALARGDLAALDAHFYSSLGRSFARVLAENPALAYREAAKVVPEPSVVMLFRAVLRSLGADPEEIEAALEGLRAGDGSRFLEAAERALARLH